MLDLIIDILGWSSDYNYSSTIVYIAGALLCIFTGITIDLLYKIFLRFFPNNLR